MNIIISIFRSSIGRKYIMAVTGLLLFGFVTVHLIGNLQIFLGPDHINAYAALLQGNKLVLWSFRIGLSAIALAHITTALSLTLENRAARPVAYLNSTPPYSDFASRTMVFGGLFLFAFILFHLLHFTVGVVHPSVMHYTDAKERHDVYRMMVESFQNPAISLVYIAGMAFLYLHLSHGISSLFQSLGLKNRNYKGLIEGFAKLAAFVILFGNCAIAIAAFTKILPAVVK
jgi:succinate dehydrogenase / fumarate reductase, cytochrome b subunit